MPWVSFGGYKKYKPYFISPARTWGLGSGFGFRVQDFRVFRVEAFFGFRICTIPVGP